MNIPPPSSGAAPPAGPDETMASPPQSSSTSMTKLGHPPTLASSTATSTSDPRQTSFLPPSTATTVNSVQQQQTTGAAGGGGGVGAALGLVQGSGGNPAGLSNDGDPTRNSSLAGFAGASGSSVGGPSTSIPRATDASLSSASATNHASVVDPLAVPRSSSALGSTSGVQQAIPPPRSASADATATSQPSRPHSARPDFPVLPSSQPAPDQKVQTASQVASILSLPTPLLLHLARTNSPAEQKEIASRAQATSYLSSMALPPPSPSHLVTSLSSTGSNQPPMPVYSVGDHPAIPVLLGQVFSPPTPGIIAPAESTTRQFQPVFASVEDWSLKAAREEVGRRSPASAATNGGRPPLTTSHSFNEREISSIASEMAKWALEEQEKQVRQQVVSAKETAVMLASQAAARTDLVNATTTNVTPSGGAGGLPGGLSQAAVTAATVAVSGGPGAGAAAFENVVQSMDLSPYAESYKRQLDALASGYFAQLHREALKRIVLAAETSPSPSGAAGSANSSGAFPPTTSTASSLPPSSSTLPTHTLTSLTDLTSGPQAQAMHVQASAAAAVAANVMAANEMASVAGTALESMGVDVPTLVPERPEGGFKSLEVHPETIAVGTTSLSAPPLPATAAAAPPPTTQVLPPPHPSTSTSGLTTSHPPEVATLLTDASTTHACTPEKRDYLLAYAHTLYAKDPQSAELLPLLHTLESIHEDHLPTLLLISCVYYTRGELESSFYYNKKLLSKDSNYVEAMSNIGTTLRAMGKWRDAETWWWKACKLRPTYWDATENLLGVLCNPSTTLAPGSIVDPADPPPTTPRYKEALALCEFIESQVYASDSNERTSRSPVATFSDPLSILTRPRGIPAVIPTNHVHRVQNLFYAKGNLRLALGDTAGAQDEYEKAVEVALAVPSWVRSRPDTTLQYPTTGCTTRDLVVVMIVLGKILAAHAQAGVDPANKHLIAEMVRALGVSGPDGKVSFERLFTVVKEGGDPYVQMLIKHGGGVLPTVLLQPEALAQLPLMLFPETHGILPSLLETVATKDTDPAQASTIQSTNQTTSTMLLTLAKVFQDASGATSPSGSLTLGGIPSSQSLLLPLYYIALALYPSPSTCNNLGILLSTMNATTIVGPVAAGGAPVLLTGQQLALRYYEAGLKIDPRHPHLFVNTGSLLKDMGQLSQAVAMYKKAVEINPTFDVALANLANAVKDTGQIQESIPFYRRAVAINPNFPEAICGLVNALGGVCDWQGRGGVGEEYVVDNKANLVKASTLAPVRPGQLVKTGYMGQISDLVVKQLNDGLSYGAGGFRSAGSLDDWLAIVAQAIYNATPAQLGNAIDSWKTRISFFFSDFDRKQFAVNEGGFLIRLVERLMRRIQRRWYLTVYGGNVASGPSTRRILPNTDDLVKYRRPVLPPSLPPVAVPTVLPFHCFTLPVSPRETRLISHRTALRISHSTLNQPWLPPIVYPPPRPPINGKINVGYVSGDLGNHPLSHLMQSVFGMHDPAAFNVFCYATSPSDGSPYRVKIEQEAQNFVDVSAYSTQQIVDRILRDEIHLLINLAGFTKGARNEVFAARPAPVQLSYMGFAGTLSAGWCDYFIVDPIVCPPTLVSGNQWRAKTGLSDNSATLNAVDGPTDFEGDPDPESASNDFVYTEKLIYLPHSYFVTDHKQAWREDESLVPSDGQLPISQDSTATDPWEIEEDKRWRMRKELFPGIKDDTIIFHNANQLYKIDPFIYRIWLNILTKHPNSILWLLRFPAPGEAHLKETAKRWVGEEVASRIVFTDVANKNDHIHRGRIADLFLDTTECNAHTTAADILWSGTPILTYPRHSHKMCSRVAASIAVATGFGSQMIVNSAAEYEQRALVFARGLSYTIDLPRAGAPVGSLASRPRRRGMGELSDLRKKLFLTREKSPLFDTRRWVHNLEQGLKEAWRRWVSGTEMEDTAEWGQGVERQTASLWIADAEDHQNLAARQKWF